MSISKMISELIRFNKTERQVFVTLRHRSPDGDVIKAERFPIAAVFSHNEKYADIYVEQSQSQSESA